MATPAQQPYNKFKNIKTTVDGIDFDSKVEAQYYQYLKQEKLMGRILDFTPNIATTHKAAYVIMDGYQLEGQRKVAAAKYIPDFIVFYGANDIDVIDVKGGDSTAEFKLKKKQFEPKYDKKVIEARWQNGQWVYS